MNLPDYNFLSAPLWLITTLHLITLTLHFLAMNFLVGGIIAMLWGKFTNRWEHPIVQKFLVLFPSAMAATVTLGVAPLLFLQLVYHQQVYAASIVSAWFWLGIIVAVIIAYYLLYSVGFTANAGAGRKPLLLSLALAALLYISFVYSSVFSMVEKPELIARLYAANQSGFVINPEIGDYLFRWLHMIFGAITVGGFFVGWLGSKNEEAFQVGRRFFLWGMVVASVFGVGYLLMIGDVLRAFMRSPAIWVLTIGVVLSAGSLHFFFKRKFVGAAVMLCVSLFAMVFTRHELRLLNLGGQFDPSTIPIRAQWSIFVVFIICFVIAIALVWYMLKMFFSAKRAV